MAVGVCGGSSRGRRISWRVLLSEVRSFVVVNDRVHALGCKPKQMAEIRECGALGVAPLAPVARGWVGNLWPF